MTVFDRKMIFPRGTIVRVLRLESKPEHNGAFCRVIGESVDSAGCLRLTIKHKDGQKMKVKALALYPCADATGRPFSHEESDAMVDRVGAHEDQRRGCLSEAERAAEDAADDRRQREKIAAACHPRGQRMAEIAALPTLNASGVPGPTDPDECHALIKAGKDEPEVWSVSFQELPIKGYYQISICVSHSGAMNDDMVMDGHSVGSMVPLKPDADVILAALWSAMVEPRQPEMTGPPHRPLKVFVAYRLKRAFAEIEAAMQEARVACVLETKGAALESAADHGLDYKGRNQSRICAACGATHAKAPLKRCSLCQSVSYCSRECQKADWKVHKPACKARAKEAEKKVPAKETAATKAAAEKSHRPAGFQEAFGAVDKKYDGPPENYDRATHPVWEYYDDKTSWVRFPERIEAGLESLATMGSPRFMYRPGMPDNDGMEERRRTASPPGNVATRHVMFADMMENEIYTGATRPVRRNGKRKPPPVAEWAREMF